MGDPDPYDVARRVRAARAYSKLSREALAEALGYSPSTIDLIEGKRAIPRGASWTELGKVAEATGLPFEFFTADFARLPEIVPEGELTVVTRRTLREAQDRLGRMQQERGQRTGEHPDTPPATTEDPDAQEGRS